MNKISKKIVALVTMAAFVLTLVPAAAFAADGTAAGSSFTVDTATANKLVVNVTLDDIDNVTLKADITGLSDATVVKCANINGNSDTTIGNLRDKGVQTATGTSVTFTVEDVTPTTGIVKVSLNGEPIGLTSAGNAVTSTNYAVYNEASPKASTIQTANSTNSELNGKTEITVNAGDKIDVEMNILDVAGKYTDKALSEVKVWTIDASSNGFSDAISYDADNGLSAGPSTNDNVTKITGSVKNGDVITAEFNRPGTYYIAVGNGTDNNTAAEDVDASLSGVERFSNTIKVTVNGGATVTDAISFEAPATGSNGEYALDLKSDGVEPNGVKVYEVTGKAVDEKGMPAAYETINLVSNKSGLALKETSVGTNSKGEFTVKFTVSKADTYKITATEANNDAKAVLTVDKSNTTAADITTVKDGGVVLAGNDSNYTANYNEASYFADAVQFEITDKNGNILSKDANIAGQNIANYGATDYIAVEKPAASTLSNADLKVIWSDAKQAYTLAYKNDDPTKDLVPGDYKVTVSLNNGKTATAEFTVAKFGTVKDLEIVLAKNSNGQELDTQIALGDGQINASAKYVDENGLKIAATGDVKYGFTGKAVADANPTNFSIVGNSLDNEALIGTTIVAKAYDDTKKIYSEKELTVVSSYSEKTLAFDSTEGPADKTNTVNVSVVDADNNIVKVTGKLYAYVDSQSNEEAIVDVSNDVDVTNGKAKLNITSDKETTVDIVVVEKNTADDEIYAKTLTYTVGKEDVNADTSVVMTIGSSDFVVNNQLVTSDAAPYVANDRTYVPFRALGEALGAKVEWDNDARTVTYVLGDNTVVMTIGDTTYTVNGEEKTMDVAPEISGERTYVPVRFVGEALGFNVTALYAADGTTASVVFQK